MAITVQIPSVLRCYANGDAELSLSSKTVRAALEQIEKRSPELYKCICNETGAVRQHVNLFVNSTLLRDPAELDETLKSGDVITVFQAVSGG